ncbi:Uncharacterized protein dnm_096410 [Desulfonema magnum]|uniref:Uncharacterized protein n=1 Tax=Desulfonema magnum TaxID=45655 RepID=A0A975GTW6_9BACT|nr:Uncharacterized protein dnm_096410 [Desulfonema magnum]
MKIFSVKTDKKTQFFRKCFYGKRIIIHFLYKILVAKSPGKSARCLKIASKFRQPQKTWSSRIFFSIDK